MNTNEETVQNSKPVASPSAVAEASAAAPPRRDKLADEKSLRRRSAMARQEAPKSSKARRISKIHPGQEGKLRSDSTWAGLTPEQRETLEGWLFEESLGYMEVLERVQREFGVTASKPSLSRYYQRLAAERAQRELLDVKTAVAEMREIGVDQGELSAAVMALLTKRLLKLLLESPDRVKEMACLGTVLVGNEAQEIKRGWLNMGREKFELEVARERAEEEAERKMMADVNAEEDYAAEDAEVLEIRRHLFGTNLPTVEPLGGEEG